MNFFQYFQYKQNLNQIILTGFVTYDHILRMEDIRKFGDHNLLLVEIFPEENGPIDRCYHKEGVFKYCNEIEDIDLGGFDTPEEYLNRLCGLWGIPGRTYPTGYSQNAYIVMNTSFRIYLKHEIGRRWILDRYHHPEVV